jgi:hypothetical protein
MPRKRRVVPEWKTLWEGLLKTADYGRLITYAELDAALGRPFVDNRSPLYKARQMMGRLNRRYLTAVPGHGYRVINANEHLPVSEDHKARARRQLTRMQEVTGYADLSHLTTDELTQFDYQTRVNATLVYFAFSHEQRLNKHEEILRRNGMWPDDDDPQPEPAA